MGGQLLLLTARGKGRSGGHYLLCNFDAIQTARLSADSSIELAWQACRSAGRAIDIGMHRTGCMDRICASSARPRQGSSSCFAAVVAAAAFVGVLCACGLI